MTPNLEECRVISLPRFVDERGSLAAIEDPLLPFQPKRFYCLYGVSAHARRGCHAHWKGQELIIAVTGGFTVAINNNACAKTFALTNPSTGIYIPPLIWHEVYDFAPGSVCAVLASEPYNPDDYIRTYDEYARATG
jgi:dTDP-4-dehydrorhamnose 3,5-epimerase-like enzyme